MTTIYRIVKKRYEAEAFDGEGAKKFGGRFNSKGSTCTYCSQHISGAMLEILVHAPDIDPHGFSCFELDIPDELIAEMNVEILEQINWKASESLTISQQIGDQWLQACDALALKIPSAICPREFNYLLNPKHEQYQAIVNAAVKIDLEFDTRLSRQ